MKGNETPFHFPLGLKLIMEINHVNTVGVSMFGITTVVFEGKAARLLQVFLFLAGIYLLINHLNKPSITIKLM
jgi:hypothetical protein